MSNNVKISNSSTSNPSSSKSKKNQNNNNMTKKAAMEMETASSTSTSATIKKPVGLQNMGNTCYMNAALQCLARTKIFISKLESYAGDYGLKLQSNGDENDIEVVKVPFVKTGSGDDDEDQSSSNVENSASSLLGDFENGSGDSIFKILKSLEGGSSSQDTEESESENNEFQNEIKDQILHDLKEKPIIINMKIPTNTMHNHLKQTLSVLMRENTEGSSADSESYTNGFGMNTYNTGRNSFRPDGIQEKLAKYFRLGHQHDSHEFLRTLLDGVKKEHIKSFRLSIMNYYGVEKNDKDNPKANLIKDLDRKFYHKTFVDDVFGGKLVSIQTCLTCKTIRHSYEKFLDLSLPIRVGKPSATTSASISSSSTKSYNSYHDDPLDYISNETIEDCLSTFTKAEVLIGPNQVECENCHKAAVSQQVVVVAENNNEVIVDDDNEENGKNGMDEGFSEEENSSGKSSLTPSPIPRAGEELEDDVVNDEIIEQPSTSKKQSQVFNKNKPLIKPKPVIKKIPITKCPCTRHQRIIQAPDFLTVHLKRFQISYRGYTQKVQDHVKFKFSLDLTQFCEPETYDDDGEVIYSLCGFVEHGGSLHWGHYVAYVRSENQWFQISDSSFHAVQTSSVFNRDPYILFYERVRGEEKSQLSKLNLVVENIVNNKVSSGVGSEASYSADADNDHPETESNDLCDSTTTAIDGDGDGTFSSKNIFEDELQMVAKEAVIALPMHTGDSPWGNEIEDWSAEPSSSSNSTSTSTNTITSTTMAGYYTELNNPTEEHDREVSPDLPTSTSDFDLPPTQMVADEENKTIIDDQEDQDEDINMDLL